MADHYASPDAQDSDDHDADFAALVEALAGTLAVKFGSLQQDILSTVQHHNTTTQDFIRNNTMQPDAIRASIAEEMGKVGVGASKRGRLTSGRKPKGGLPPELEDDPTLPYFRVSLSRFIHLVLYSHHTGVCPQLRTRRPPQDRGRRRGRSSDGYE